MNRLLFVLVCPFLLAVLTACSSSDDDADTDENTAETSELAPGGDVDQPPSSTPGGDTSAIAGLWDAVSGEPGSIDERYVLIGENGLYTDYDFRQDDLASDGNCYEATGPYTLTLEEAESNTYGISDDRIFSATKNTEATELTITFTEQDAQTWPVVTGIAAEDLQLCS